MKTYTASVKTARYLIDGIYDKDAATYANAANRGDVFMQINVPAELQAHTAKAARLKIYAKGKKGYFITQVKHSYSGFSYARPSPKGVPDTVSVDQDQYPQQGFYWTAGQRYDFYDTAGPLWLTLSFVPNYVANGLIIRLWGQTSTLEVDPGITQIWTERSSYVPYVEIDYDEGVLITEPIGPTGMIDRTQAQTFFWRNTWSGYPVESVAQTSATLQWKDGENGTVHSISISGDDTDYTMAANTLPESTDIRWRVNAVTAEGTATGQWTSLRTQDAVPVAVAVSPTSSYVVGTEAVRFVWRHDISTGTAQTRFDLQTCITGGSWTDLATVNTADTFYTAPAGSLPTGGLQWRVRTYNQNSQAGDWSAPLSIVVIGAPTVTALQADGTSPRPVISWESADQQAFQVQIGSFDSGHIFGTAKTYRCPVYIPDGTTAVRVRVQNEYAFWSEWAEIFVNIANTPGVPAALTVYGSPAAQLSWSATDAASAWRILRDGREIAEIPASPAPDPTYVSGAEFSWTQGIISATGANANSNYSIRTGYLPAADYIGKKWRSCGPLSANGAPYRTYIVSYSDNEASSMLARDMLLTDDSGTNILELPEGTNYVRFMLLHPTATGVYTKPSEAPNFQMVSVEDQSGSYEDRTAAPGTHTYAVRAAYADRGSYTDSNAVEHTIAVEGTVIGAVDGGSWLDIGLSATITPSTNEGRSATVAMLQLAGAAYPVPEVSPARQRSYQISFATTSEATGRAFEALLARVVALKDQYGASYVGIIASMTRARNFALISYSAVLQEVDESAYQIR